MNEYQDQDSWFRVEGETEPGLWEFIADTDFDHEADAVRAEYAELDPELKTRVRRVHGLSA